MKVVIREEAADDLDGIFAWVAKDDPVAAVNLLRRLRSRIGRLAVPGFAHMGRPGAVEHTRELVDAPYITVYRVHEQRSEIEVLAVFHARQDR